jgi:hypothetical protein
MSDQPSALQELADVPKDFFKEGTQFINRCTKRTYNPTQFVLQPEALSPGPEDPVAQECC